MMRWNLPEPIEAFELRSFADSLRVPTAIAELLWRRGYRTPEAAKRHMEPKLGSLEDPFELPDMDKAVSRLLRAVDSGESIVLYGDYDVDGVTSLALLQRILKEFGAQVRCFLPVRETEGYGLSALGMERCKQESRPSLLVAVDCGTSSAAEIAQLSAEGIDVIVLDHHECPPELPACVALVNPKRGSRFEYLCSVGVVFKLAHALLKKRRIPSVDLREYLDLVALGTVADLVPLQAENRILVRRGLAQMEHSRWAGIHALMRVAAVNPPLAASDVGFKLGPRMNAAGRLGTARDALELLLSEDRESAQRLAGRLDSQNRERRGVEETVLQEAEAQVEASYPEGVGPAIVVGATGWHPGVLGIVASRLMRKYYRPSIVVGFDEQGMGKGSGRSIEGLPLVAALGTCAPLLEKYGGHDMAAGVSLRKEKFLDFQRAFAACAASYLDSQKLTPSLEIDAELFLGEVSEGMLSQYEALAPFGMGNPQPLFLLRGVSPAGTPRLLKEKHMQFLLRQGSASSRAMWFNAPAINLPEAPWDLAVELTRNEFQGVVSPQVLVRALRKSE